MCLYREGLALLYDKTINLHMRSLPQVCLTIQGSVDSADFGVPDAVVVVMVLGGDKSLRSTAFISKEKQYTLSCAYVESFLPHMHFFSSGQA